VSWFSQSGSPWKLSSAMNRIGVKVIQEKVVKDQTFQKK
jgi:hypothetical protein